MIYANEKLLLSLNATLEHIPEEADRIEMKEILGKLYVRQQKGESVKLIRNKSASIRIHDMAIDYKHQIAVFLIHYSDTTVSDPVFSELQSGKLRVESKLEGEGIAVSTHLVFSMEPIRDRADVYDAIVEETPGVNRMVLNQFFTSEFRIVSDFRFKVEGKEYQSRPRLKLSGKLSKGLEEDLKKGQLSGITLEKFKVKDFMDEESVMIPRKSSVELRVTSKISPKKRKSILANATDLVKRMHKKAKNEGYDNVIVHFKTENKRSKTVGIETKFKNAMDVLYTKSHATTLENSVEQCEPEFNNEIIDNMKDLLLSLRKSRKEADAKKPKIIRGRSTKRVRN